METQAILKSRQAAMVEAIGGCGTPALVGIARSGAVIDPVKLVESEITLVGCHAFSTELAEVAAKLSSLSPKLDAFIAEQIPLVAVPDAYSAPYRWTVGWVEDGHSVRGRGAERWEVR